jgi:hypothetical protein
MEKEIKCTNESLRARWHWREPASWVEKERKHPTSQYDSLVVLDSAAGSQRRRRNVPTSHYDLLVLVGVGVVGGERKKATNKSQRLVGGRHHGHGPARSAKL